MDLDNIQDIEVLRNKLKNFYVKMKRTIEYNTYDGRKCVFKEGFWYILNQDEGGVYLINEDEDEQPWIWMEVELGEEIPFYVNSKI